MKLIFAGPGNNRNIYSMSLSNNILAYEKKATAASTPSGNLLYNIARVLALYKSY